MAPLIPTKLLILSDTHGLRFDKETVFPPVDVVIHCGDLTEHSKLSEFEETRQLLRDIDAPLKVVIAGNHDFSLDEAAFERKIAEARRVSDEDIDDLVIREYGENGAARAIWREAAEHDNIILMDEGTHHFTLHNGASLTVYASPYTPSADEWGFQYTHSHDFDIKAGVDVAVTHGPPRGIMDMTAERTRIGCPDLFRAVAQAQPKIHCFGHVHNGWGAKMVAWRPADAHSNDPSVSHFTAIDNDKSLFIESLTSLRGSKFETDEEREIRAERISRYERQGYRDTSHCHDDEQPLCPARTLFVNAANKGDQGMNQFPWLVHVDLESSVGASMTDCRVMP